VRLTLLFCAIAAALQAQTAAGVEPTWDIAVVLDAIGANAASLSAPLGKLDAPAWVAKGASPTYAEQVQASREQARALADGARALARNPERLSGGLELFFRMEALERMITSVEEAARRYQSAAAAQELAGVYAEGGVNRERMRKYIVNLAAEREHQFEVMDKEAQRCRDTLMATPPPAKSTARKK
jgi:methyl-accepting chemotaxis protein